MSCWHTTPDAKGLLSAAELLCLSTQTGAGKAVRPLRAPPPPPPPPPRAGCRVKTACTSHKSRALRGSTALPLLPLMAAPVAARCGGRIDIHSTGYQTPRIMLFHCNLAGGCWASGSQSLCWPALADSSHRRGKRSAVQAACADEEPSLMSSNRCGRRCVAGACGFWQQHD